MLSKGAIVVLGAAGCVVSLAGGLSWNKQQQEDAARERMLSMCSQHRYDLAAHRGGMATPAMETAIETEWRVNECNAAGR